jgi:hypothetical protein
VDVLRVDIAKVSLAVIMPTSAERETGRNNGSSDRSLAEGEASLELMVSIESPGGLDEANAIVHECEDGAFPGASMLFWLQSF